MKIFIRMAQTSYHTTVFQMIHLSINNTQHVMMPDKYEDKKQKTSHKLYRVEEPVGMFRNDYFTSGKYYLEFKNK